MYIPKHYNTTDRKAYLQFMQQFNFATIVCNDTTRPVATHLPFIVFEKEDNIILSAHFAKANPQWQGIEDKEVLVIFSEPHAYISPKNYNKKQNVPTWNYVSVHAYGKAKIITEQQAVFHALEQLMEVLEPSYKKQWEGLSMDYKIGMANGIVAFEIEVTEIQAKEKLSQNKKPEEQERIIENLKQSEHEHDNLIGEYMQKKFSKTSN